MSAGQKRRHREKLARRAVIDPGEHYAVQTGWARNESDLPEVRKRTHDLLVEQMGRARTGGVSWGQYQCVDADAIMAKLWENLRPGDMERSNTYRRLAGMLREYGGWLVVAMAPGRRH